MKIGDEEPQLSCSDERTVEKETGRRKMSLLHHLYCVCVCVCVCKERAQSNIFIVLHNILY